MRWIFLMTALVLIALPARAGHKPTPIFLRIHVQMPGEGLPDSQAKQVMIPPNNDTIQVRALPELSERDLVGIVQDPSGPVHLQFSHTGQVNLSAFTAENQGRIMVVLINGFVVYSPIIDQQITSGELTLPRALPADIFQLLQQTAAENVRQKNKE